MVDTRGGFILPDALPEGANGFDDTGLELRNQPAVPIPVDAVCRECKSIDLCSDLFRHYAVMVCRQCKEQHKEKYALLTKTECREDYLLTDSELRDTARLPHWMKKNPHKESYANMLLYLRMQVEAFAIEKWGSLEKLDDEFARRESEKTIRKKAKFEKKLVELRKKTLTSTWKRPEKDHVHEYGPKVALEDGFTFEQTLTKSNMLSTTVQENAATLSCKALSKQATRGIQVSSTGIAALLSEFPVSAYEAAKAVDPFALPLRFDSVAAELDVLALTCALSFGAGFKPFFTDKGAFDAVRFGVMSMYISEGGGGRCMTAAGMKDTSLSDVASLFDIPLNNEVSHPTLQFVTVSEHHPLRPFAQHIKDVLNETGDILSKNGYSSLGAFIVKVSKKPSGGVVNVQELVEILAKAFPCFRDAGVVDGQEVLFLTKAQRLAYHVHKKFPTLVTMSTPTPLTAAADPAIVSTLISAGIIEIPQSVRDLLESEADFEETEQMDIQHVLRAAGVAAVDAVLAAAEESPELKGKLDSMGLGMYFRSLPRMQKLRIINKGSVFF
ncbi:UNVERIFIED_CONTAM: hypothetical protein HDU68_011168 [Siphonaria sp. JEL0065]|nr:hypothetical protein HDU68_011168 [Siphonaria sp. JEL0065]